MQQYNTNHHIRTLGRIDSIFSCLDLLPSLKSIGLSFINIGVESADENILKSMKKRNNTEQLQVIREHAENCGITLLYNILIGMPEESNESLNSTFSFLKNHKFLSTSCSLLCPLPGAHIYNEVISLGLANPEDLDFNHYLNNFSKVHESQPYVPSKYLGIEELRNWHNLFSSLMKTAY